jgi:uncharacterized protein
VNLLISGLVEDDSRILINTDLRSRVQKIAPFLEYDHDPYAAIVDGRLKWIWDAYTTSNTYPYSQRVELADLTGGDLSGEANYIRNSVKVVIDAYDGTTTFYLVDDQDPVINAWREVFPDLFTPLAEAPEELQAHFRYPEDLFRVQAHQYANYHVTDARQFYAKEDFWSVPQVSRDPEDAATDLEPYYVLVPLPGEEEARFLLFTPFTPADRPNMVAWMAADSDPATYGQLTSFQFQGRNVVGPAQVTSLISQDTEVSRELSLFDQLGSRVIYGDVLAIPIGQSFLYVQPLYLRTAQEAAGIPELKRVVVVNGEQVQMSETLGEALAILFEGAAEQPQEPGEEPTEPAADVAGLLAEAQQHFDAAQEALTQGDLATYQAEIEAAEAAIQQAAALAGVGTQEEQPAEGGGGGGGGT